MSNKTRLFTWQGQQIAVEFIPVQGFQLRAYVGDPINDEVRIYFVPEASADFPEAATWEERLAGALNAMALQRVVAPEHDENSTNAVFVNFQGPRKRRSN